MKNIAIYLLFLLSGVSALIYQTVWQRILFGLYGVNIQATTIIVAIFMLGLGLGSLIGGFLSKKKNLLLYFSIFEGFVGVFGFFSLKLFNIAFELTDTISGFYLFMLSFVLLIFPTSAMGATLPILTEYLIKKFHNIGQSLGILYFVNTLGAALSSIVTAIFFMKFFGLSNTIKIAASINIAIAIGMLLIHFKEVRK
jgi:predicted membrane-bound spermidine synthase